MFFFTKETLKEENRMIPADGSKTFSGFSVVMKDKLYITSVFLNGMIYITSAGVFNLLSLYAGQNFGIPVNQISYVFTVNALMCVTLQLPVIRMIRGKKPLALMSISGFLYALSVSSIALVDQVWWYCLCMAVMTTGELIMSPTMSDIAANLAPADARGRYMSVLSLARPFGQGVGPAFLGFVNDMISPRMMWVSGAMFAAAASAAFYYMNRNKGDSDRLKHY
jgi:MFS family permease